MTRPQTKPKPITARDERRSRVEAELCHDVQMLLVELMYDDDISQRQLARRLGISEARVSQFFVPGWRMTVPTLAAVMLALGQRVIITTRDLNRLE